MKRIKIPALSTALFILLGNASAVFADAPPVADNAVIGGNPVAGGILTGYYDYTDGDGEVEDGSEYLWEEGESSAGPFMPIAGETAESLACKAEFAGRYVRFSVTPKNSGGTGARISSPAIEVEETRSVFDAATPSVVFEEDFHSYNTGETVLVPNFSSANKNVKIVNGSEMADNVNTGKYMVFKQGTPNTAYNTAEASTGIGSGCDKFYLEFAFKTSTVAAGGRVMIRGNGNDTETANKNILCNMVINATDVRVSDTAFQSVSGHSYTFSNLTSEKWYRIFILMDITGGQAFFRLRDYATDAGIDEGSYVFNRNPPANPAMAQTAFDQLVFGGGALSDIILDDIKMGRFNMPAPRIQSAGITGAPYETGGTLYGHYTYNGILAESVDALPGSVYTWYRADLPSGWYTAVKTGRTTAADGASYTLSREDKGKYFKFGLNPSPSSSTEVITPAAPVITGKAEAPTASAVTVSGEARIGGVLTASYSYSDFNGDVEDGSTYRWLKRASVDGVYTQIDAGTTTADAGSAYTITAADMDNYIVFEITPANASAKFPVGTAAVSEPFLVANLKPEAKNVTFTGAAVAGLPLTGGYEYVDMNGDAEAGSVYYVAASDTADFLSSTVVASGNSSANAPVTFTPGEAEWKKFLRLEIVPKNIVPPDTGDRAYSAVIGPVERPAGNPGGTNAPRAENVTLSGVQKPGATLTGWYDYYDPKGEPEYGTEIVWYRVNMAENVSEVAQRGGLTYVCTAADDGFGIQFEVTPKKDSFSDAVGAPQTGEIVLIGTDEAGYVKRTVLEEDFEDAPVVENQSPWTYNLFSGDKISTLVTVVDGTKTEGEKNATKYPYVNSLSDKAYAMPSDDGKNLSGIVDVSVDINSDAPVNPAASILGNSTDLNTSRIALLRFTNNAGATTYTSGTPSTNYGDGTARIATLQKGRWYTFKFRIDFNKNTVTCRVDGAEIGTYTFNKNVNTVKNSYLSKIEFYQNTRFDNVRIESLTATAPTAGTVGISGISAEGGDLTGTYTFFALSNEAAGGSAYKWYRGDTPGGPFEVVGEGRASAGNLPKYRLTAADAGSYIKFEITPSSTDGETGAASSAVSGRVTASSAAEPTAPEASDVTISGSAVPGGVLNGSYRYYDRNGDLENGSELSWLASSSADGANPRIAAAGTSFTLTQNEAGKYIFFSVIPKNGAAPTVGAAAISVPVFVSDAPSARNVIISANGTVKAGNSLRGSYDFAGGVELGSTYRWLRSETLNGTYAEIDTNLSYVVTKGDEGKYLKFEVTPKNADGAVGAPSQSSPAFVSGGGNTPPSGGGGGGGNYAVNMPQNTPAPPQIPDGGANAGNEPPEAPSFNDTSAHWAKDDIEWANRMGLMNGASGAFEPNRAITRAEFAAVTVRLTGVSDGGYNGEFADVSAVEWFAPSVAAAFKAGFISGYGGYFRPHDSLTREEMAKMMWLAYKSSGGGEVDGAPLDGFADNYKVSPWASVYLEKTTALGLIRGNGEPPVLSPLSAATRAETAVVLRRVYNTIAVSIDNKS
jgi:hypothetical protein